MFLLFAVAVFR